MAVSLAKTSNDPIVIAIITAFGIHAFIILGIGFTLNPHHTPTAEPALDITLVTQSQPKQNNKAADFLAQSTQQGGGEEISKARPGSPLGYPTATPKPEAAPELKPGGINKPRPKKQPTVITREKNSHRQAVNTRPDVKAPQSYDLAQILVSTQKEIDRLTAELDNRSLAAAKRLRRKAINASTQEYLYAAYLDAWRKKVERIGNLNYPDEARRKKLYGSLLLHVAVHADGSLADIRLVRSSRHKLLDDAAIRIVRLAAPFAPFPPEMRKQVDILDITRTWKFSKGHGLSTR